MMKLDGDWANKWVSNKNSKSDALMGGRFFVEKSEIDSFGDG